MYVNGNGDKYTEGPSVFPLSVVVVALPSCCLAFSLPFINLNLPVYWCPLAFFFLVKTPKSYGIPMHTLVLSSSPVLLRPFSFFYLFLFSSSIFLNHGCVKVCVCVLLLSPLRRGGPQPFVARVGSTAR